jgi:hypothetical protein
VGQNHLGHVRFLLLDAHLRPGEALSGRVLRDPRAWDSSAPTRA